MRYTKGVTCYGKSMASKSIHVVRKANGQWAVRSAGKSCAASVHGTQGEAIAAAKEKAKKLGSNLVVHRTNGRIRDFRSYSN